MKVIRTESENKNKKLRGVDNPDKIALYDDVAQYLADILGATVSHVKPTVYKCEETGKSKKTGCYGLAFEKNGQLYTLEIVAKDDKISLENFIVEAETTPM